MNRTKQIKLSKTCHIELAVWLHQFTIGANYFTGAVMGHYPPWRYWNLFLGPFRFSLCYEPAAD